MKRHLVIILSVLLLSGTAHAAHIKGGFFTYKYLGPGSGTNLRYQITLTVYMGGLGQAPDPCMPSPGQLNNPINFSIFDAATNQFLQNASVSITSQYTLSKVYDEPCIDGDQRQCYYHIVIYDLPSIELPATPGGYIISYQRCCRIAGIINVVPPSGAVGNTFTIRIPGTGGVPGAETNSSPGFLINDTVVVCRNSYFQYSFQATDVDGDSLSYSFCSAYIGADQNNSAPPTAAPPPYSIIPYQLPYSGTQPMGPGVTINPITGLISGIAPDVLGQFVLCVCVNEFRNGIYIGTTRKELHVEIGQCEPLNALLSPRNATCDGYTVSFSNEVSNPPGTLYLWIFGDPASGSLDTSILPSDTHIYTDTGVYIVKLKVSLPGGICADSTTQIVRVFPGFVPGFVFNGSCYTNPYLFTDTTNTAFGFVNSWSWNFGDVATLDDTSHIRNPQWTYPGPGTRDVTLIVTNSKGCIDTAQVTIDVIDKPALAVDFADTLICRNDAVQLNAVGTGSFSWSPPVNIINANTSSPTVSPTSSQWYYVDLNDAGCLNRDSVHVRVVNNVTLQAMQDTTICQGDAIQLYAISDGLSFSWTPAANLDNPNIINPIAITNTTTPYTVVANIGSCTASDQIIVTTIPYPGANAGNSPTICYNTPAQLNGSMVGISFTWTPTNYLNNPNILNPIATPPRTTQYILSVYDTLGCPKPGRDTVTVIVRPKIIAFAGHDTAVVINQPLQFQGTGGMFYFWSPSTGLNNTGIADPIGIYGPGIDSVRYKLIVSDEAGCPDSAYVTVHVFQTMPYIFVPTAFTPNNDGLNDVVRPIAVGIREIKYFSIFNRWGERVFYTTTNKQGWDGRHNGKLQGSAVFVWMVSAIDYLGKPLFLKGTVTLIR